MADPFTLHQSYDDYPQIEEEFQAFLDESLHPRGSEMLYDRVAGFGLAAGAEVVDAGCGEGRQAVELATRFGFRLVGLDPVPRHIELAGGELAAAAEHRPDLSDRVRFRLGRIEDLPVEDASVDLVWCKDVLVHVVDLDAAYREMGRVLRPGGRAVVYQSCLATGPVDPEDVERRKRTLGVVPTSTDLHRHEAAIAAAGLQVEEALDVGIEWGEAGEERSGTGGRRLVHAARLLRDPGRYIARFGQAAYDIMLDDCFWHVDHMLGRQGGRVWTLSRS